MRKTARGLLVMLIMTVFMVTLQPAAAYGQNQDLSSGESAKYLENVMKMIKEKYNGEIDDRQLIEGALKGMFQTMDPYTTYYTNEEASSFFESIEGSYEGIGISMEMYGDGIRVETVFPGSPAEKSGLVPGDIILKVDGTALKGLGLAEIGNIIKGKAGTQVTLGVLRKTTGKDEEIKVERASIELDPGSYKIVGDIGYIKLDMFTSSSYDFMVKAVDYMDKNNIKKLILDLRDNPGGEVDQAVRIARIFVPKGLIARLDFKYEDTNDEEYYSYLSETKYKLVLLVNENSASASEIVSGAVQDTQAGVLVGTKTFGKARVQSIIPILTPEAYAKYENQLGVKLVDVYELMSKYNVKPYTDEIMGWIKITTGEYFTPNDRMINGKGLMPDVMVTNPTTSQGVDMNYVGKISNSRAESGMLDKNDILNGEMILKALGYNIEEPDTKADEETTNAVKAFQQDNGVEQTGIFDSSTVEKLNSTLDELLLKMDEQYAKAIQVVNN